MAAPTYKQIINVATQNDLPIIADDGQMAFVRDSQTTLSFNLSSSSWMPLGRSAVLRSSVNVNAKSVGSTLVYTLPPSSLYFYPTGVIVRAVNITGVGTAPVMTIGSNSTGYDNIATSSLVNTILGMIDVNNGSPMMATFSPGLAGGVNIYAKVNTIALVYSNYTVKFDILGFYDSTTP
jgi:hypothetical protein